MAFEDQVSSQRKDPYALKPECIIADKVYDSCFQRECEPSVVLPLPEDCKQATYLSTKFKPGVIVDGTLRIKPLKHQKKENFARVSFTLKVPFISRVRNEATGSVQAIAGHLQFEKSMIMYVPDSRDEFTFEIMVETLSEVLEHEIIGKKLILSIGVFIVVKVVGKVQLLVQTLGFCPQPRECDDEALEDVCDEFLKRPLPPFFPPQKKTRP
ncbi:MAG TPA: hypothetical protein GXZ32_01395 [Clostridiales bacterium]|nr:hypothetical protein [Clostridiales bacterium]